MQTIILAARKGGPGKTTLAAHLAIQAERDGAGPVMLVDLDPQQTLTAWWKDRQAETPILSEVPITRFRDELASVRDKPGLIIVDTPGFEADLLTLITAADFVVIPVQPSPNDLRGIATTVDLAKRAQRPFCFVITVAYLDLASHSKPRLSCRSTERSPRRLSLTALIMPVR